MECQNSRNSFTHTGKSPNKEQRRQNLGTGEVKNWFNRKTCYQLAVCISKLCPYEIVPNISLGLLFYWNILEYISYLLVNLTIPKEIKDVQV